MATREELFEAMRRIKEHCKNCDFCRDCPLSYKMNHLFICKFETAPCEWPDPEGGGEDG